MKLTKEKTNKIINDKVLVNTNTKDEERLKGIEVRKYKLQYEQKTKENIVPCADFYNQEDVLKALQYILDNEWKKSEKMIAFVFKSSTGETMEEDAFYEKAVKFVRAPELMAKIAEKALHTHSIEYCYGTDGLTTAFIYLFTHLISNHNEYFELGWRFCTEMDRDHEEDFSAVLHVSMCNLDRNERMKYYEKYPDIREWLDDRGHGF